MGSQSEDEFEEERKFEFLQYLLYVFNTIFFVGGALIFAIGMYVTYDSSMGDYLEGTQMDFYLNATAVLMTAACFVVLNAFVGCCGAFLVSRRTLIFHMVLTVITFVVLLGASGYLLANGLEQSNLAEYIEEAMKELIYQYELSTDAKRSVDIIQENIGCCGGSGFEDYIDIHLPIPDTCRDQVTGNQYIDSCMEVLSQFLEKRTGWMCGLALSLCFLQIFSMTSTVYAYVYINRLRNKM